MSAIRKLWWGEYLLALTFWGFYVFGVIASMLCAAVVMIPLYFLHLPQLGFGVGSVAFASYWIVASIGVWRSADAYPHTRWWPALAKIVVCLWAARMVW